MRNIGIIGGGASGLVAAIVAARTGAKVTIIERQNRIGKKILVTGNGRCNLTNTKVEAKHYHTHSQNSCFGPIEKINKDEILTFFEELGIELLIENKKVYPASEQANSILDVMRMELDQWGVQVELDQKVTSLKQQGQGWKVSTEQGAMYNFDAVIVATGGMAAPQLGCDTTGYQLLKDLGHTMHRMFPTIVHIVSPTSYCKMMKGTRVKGDVRIWVDGKMKRTEYGEVLFTEDGLSGPSIFQLSRIAAAAELKGKKSKVVLDLFPKQSQEELVGKLYERIGRHPYKTIEELFVGWLHKRVAIPVIKYAQIGTPAAPCENLEYEMVESLARAMKQLTFDVTGTRGFKFAQATAGGINIDEVNLETMASQKANNLYITGEVLDVDGDCGGYNLQWAWSTGYIAGLEAAKE